MTLSMILWRKMKRKNIDRGDEDEDLLEHDDGAQTASPYHPEDDADTFHR